MEIKIKEGLVYQDPDGIWEVLEVYENMALIENIQDGNSNKGAKYIVEIEEIEYFANDKYWN